MIEKPASREEKYNEDPCWSSLFEMAGSYEDLQEDISEYNVEASMKNMVKKVNYHTPEEALKVLFGYDTFRQGQKSIIENILAGRDTFAVMPTGAGKSVCYQVPAVLLPGITLVISPLISLMQDQVKSLNEAGISAAYINSSLSESKFFETLQRVKQGLYQIIYVAPERLITESFKELAKNVKISMLTVDEAHCISQWGQDFRPSYMKIVEFVQMLSERPIISAFTATATKNVRDDIVCTLGLNNPFCLVTGFDRENLFFQVEKPVDKDQYIINYLAEHVDDGGIIYCATRKNVDKLYELIKSRGISVAKYHAGMSAADRKKMQDQFIFDYISVVVATNAFGMGIDKSNVRFVIHYNMPQSMENYYQEAGRAGRDGIDSKCILLFSPQDIVINRFLLEHKEMADLNSIDKETVRERDSQRLKTMEHYCYTAECLRNYILKYFGEKPEKPCEDCGNCLREFETIDMTDEAKQIINCVYEAKGRYGKNIIIGTVTGAKTARIEEIGSVNYKTYGVLEKTNKKLLMRLMEQLVLESYLIVGDYQVIKLGEINRLKNPDTHILIKITDEDKIPEKISKKKPKGMEVLTSTGYKLFDKLRELRLVIAREESMPPYIIFSDKTLIDMAGKVPASRAEMLNVSGVGESKYNKYGVRFLALIDEFLEKYPELAKSKIVENEIGENATIELIHKSGRKKSGKKEFFLTESDAVDFKYVDFYYISDIRDELNRICRTTGIKKLAATRIVEYLVSEDLVREQDIDGRFTKIQTEKGLKIGIKTIEKVSEKGFVYTLLMYPPEVQKMIVNHYVQYGNVTLPEEIS